MANGKITTQKLYTKIVEMNAHLQERQKSDDSQWSDMKKEIGAIKDDLKPILSHVSKQKVINIILGTIGSAAVVAVITVILTLVQ